MPLLLLLVGFAAAAAAFGGAFARRGRSPEVGCVRRGWHVVMDMEG